MENHMLAIDSAESFYIIINYNQQTKVTLFRNRPKDLTSFIGITVTTGKNRSLKITCCNSLGKSIIF